MMAMSIYYTRLRFALEKVLQDIPPKESPTHELHARHPDTSCSMPCTCRDVDRTSPSWKQARRRTW